MMANLTEFSLALVGGGGTGMQSSGDMKMKQTILIKIISDAALGIDIFHCLDDETGLEWCIYSISPVRRNI
jgi:hypothetical protein